jgi:DNA-binding MarR family transcriptional regulator
MVRRDENEAAREAALKQVYEYIGEYLEEYHYAPSIREIAEGCYIARGTATLLVDILEARGYISRDIGVPRSIALTERMWEDRL